MNAEFVVTGDWSSREAFHAFERPGGQDMLTAPPGKLRESANMEVADLLVHVEGDER